MYRFVGELWGPFRIHVNLSMSQAVSLQTKMASGSGMVIPAHFYALVLPPVASSPSSWKSVSCTVEC